MITKEEFKELTFDEKLELANDCIKSLKDIKILLDELYIKHELSENRGK